MYCEESLQLNVSSQTSSQSTGDECISTSGTTSSIMLQIIKFITLMFQMYNNYCRKSPRQWVVYDFLFCFVSVQQICTILQQLQTVGWVAYDMDRFCTHLPVSKVMTTKEWYVSWKG